MVIVKNPVNISLKEQEEINANFGCDKCPICGEKSKFSISDKMSGILKIPKVLVTRKGFLHEKYYARDKYICFTCGAEYMSEKYRCDV